MPHTSVSSTTSSPSASRSRLRGFGYLRSHAHHHNPDSNDSTSGNSNNNSSSLTAPVGVAHLPNVNDSLSSPTSSTSPRRSTSPLTNNNPMTNGGGTSSWLPTVGGVSGLSRVPTAPAAESSHALRSHSPSGNLVADGAPLVRTVSEDMPMSRSIDAALSLNHDGAPVFSSTLSALSCPTGGPAERSYSHQLAADAQHPAPSIRFVPHIDPRSTRQSLIFSPMERTLRHSDEVIRVGRYSDRDAGNPAPVGFKSKVVSRRHCEFWCHNGQWYVKDVKSSSGTFLNHIRLSSPGVESKAFPLFDGDIIQLGIDFKGGEELIFRCVKIRVELNRAWQKGLNNFNVSTHKKLQALGKNLTKPKDSDASSTHTSECAICLMNVAPCQSLFVAPCSHVWHYKCVRPIILKSYPTFLCPNCRAVADLERDIEEDNTWQVVEEELAAHSSQPNINAQSDQDDDGVVVVNSAQPSVIPPGTTSAKSTSSHERPVSLGLSRSPPSIAVNGAHESDVEITGTDVTNDEHSRRGENESPSASAASASSLIGDRDRQQVMSAANETFVSLDNDNDDIGLQDPAAALAMLGLNQLQEPTDNDEGSSSRPADATSRIRNVSDDVPSLNLGPTVGAPSRGDMSNPENAITRDNGPLTPTNHVGPFVLDGLLE